MLLTRIEYFPDYSDDKVEALRQAVEQITPDYAALLERHRQVQSEMLNRVTVDFGGASQYGMSVEELLADQRSRPDFSPALLEKVFEMGRHWFILNSGKYPSIAAEVKFTINLQTAGAVPGDLRPGEEVRPRARSSANGRCRPGRPPRRDGSLLQLDREPGAGLPGQRQEHLRVPRRVVSRFGRTKEWASSIITPAAPP